MKREVRMEKDFKSGKRNGVKNNNNNGKGYKGEESQTWTKWKNRMGRP